jgi:hypothetical protein
VENTENAPKRHPPTAAALGVPKKKNGLSRRKSPAPAVDQWLAEREAQMREETGATVETCPEEAPVEEHFTPFPPRALKKPPAVLPAKNGLSRRKSPAPDVHQWLVEREAQIGGVVVGTAPSIQGEETAPAEDNFPHVQSREPKEPAPVATQRAKNGLSRRKSPAPVIDQWLMEREARIRATEEAPVDVDRDEETVPLDDSFLSTRNPVPMDEETQELPFYLRSNGYTLAGVTGVMMAGGRAILFSEDGSVVMETDEEPLIETQSDAPVPEQSRWTNPPEVSLFLVIPSTSLTTLRRMGLQRIIHQSPTTQVRRPKASISPHLSETASRQSANRPLLEKSRPINKDRTAPLLVRRIPRNGGTKARSLAARRTIVMMIMNHRKRKPKRTYSRPKWPFMIEERYSMRKTRKSGNSSLPPRAPVPKRKGVRATRVDLMLSVFVVAKVPKLPLLLPLQKHRSNPAVQR